MIGRSLGHESNGKKDKADKREDVSRSAEG